MAIHSMTQSRVGDSAISIAVHDTEIRIVLAESPPAIPAFARGSSADIRRTANALLGAADELDRIEDARRGIDWWNELDERERSEWLGRARSAVPADAWAEYKAARAGAAEDDPPR